MKNTILIVSILLLLSGISAVSAASISGNTVTATNPLDASALVYVSGYEISPAIFYPGETGTVTVHITNAANTSVSVSQPDLIEPHVKVLNSGAFATATSIGPGETVDYNFVISVDGSDATYFPLFTVSTTVYGASAIHSQIVLKIDSTDVRASISAKPDTFSVSKKDNVNVSVVNPRSGDITNVLIVPSAEGASVSPSEFYAGTVKAGSSVQVPFAITPERATDVTFRVVFNNGDNKHTTNVVLPLNLGQDKLAAVPIINNIAVTSSGFNYQMTGDVNNAGITDAKGMVLTVDPPARAVEPYPEYAIGSLASDDFSSFELTFATNDLSAVPVKVSWKDTDGNSFSAVKTLNLGNYSGSSGSTARTGSSGSSSASSGTSSSGTRGGFPGGPPGGGGIFGFGGSRSSGGLSAFYLPIGLGIIVIVAVVLWMKRKWIAARLKKK
jgi:hypothetical protein